MQFITSIASRLYPPTREQIEQENRDLFKAHEHSEESFDYIAAYKKKLPAFKKALLALANVNQRLKLSTEASSLNCTFIHNFREKKDALEPEKVLPPEPVDFPLLHDEKLIHNKYTADLVEFNSIKGNCNILLYQIQEVHTLFNAYRRAKAAKLTKRSRGIISQIKLGNEKASRDTASKESTIDHDHKNILRIINHIEKLQIRVRIEKTKAKQNISNLEINIDRLGSQLYHLGKARPVKAMLREFDPRRALRLNKLLFQNDRPESPLESDAHFPYPMKKLIVSKKMFRLASIEPALTQRYSPSSPIGAEPDNLSSPIENILGISDT